MCGVCCKQLGTGDCERHDGAAARKLREEVARSLRANRTPGGRTHAAKALKAEVRDTVKAAEAGASAKASSFVFQ